jgi:acyl-CoA reductase-like NAD-dependent aldehyde dehydrogenase
MERAPRSGSRRSARATRSTLERRLGAQVSTAQLEKIEATSEIGLDEGAELLIGGEPAPPRR